jgi:hypothetical protein
VRGVEGRERGVVGVVGVGVEEGNDVEDSNGGTYTLSSKLNTGEEGRKGRDGERVKGIEEGGGKGDGVVGKEDGEDSNREISTVSSIVKNAGEGRKGRGGEQEREGDVTEKGEEVEIEEGEEDKGVLYSVE